MNKVKVVEIKEDVMSWMDGEVEGKKTVVIKGTNCSIVLEIPARLYIYGDKLRYWFENDGSVVFEICNINEEESNINEEEEEETW